MRCGLVWWEGGPAVRGGSCQRVEEHSAMQRRGDTSIHVCAGMIGVEGVAVPGATWQ